MSELNTAAAAVLNEVAAIVAGAEAPVAAAPAARVRRTKEELIAFYEQKIADLKSGKVTVRSTEPKAKKVEFVPVVGEVYDFYFGRGDNRAVLRGKVLGIREPAEGEKGGRIAKVMVGEGYDADIKGVFLSAFIDPAAEVEADDAALDFPPSGDDQE